MGAYIIEGGRRLTGEAGVQGAKNSALPILAACVVSAGVHVIHNCPRLSDIEATVNILRYLGCTVTTQGHTVTVDSTGVNRSDIPDRLMREMRSSVIFLGAIAARTGTVELSTPGGCEIGLRPIDLHVEAMRKLGAQVCDEYGHIRLDCPGGLTGAKISLSFPSVGATENIMIAAATAKGTTVIVNAAREPEISDLADFLNRCGARIAGAGEGVVTVEGVKGLHAAEHTVIPDRIAASTFMCAAAVTHGSIVLKNVIPAHIGPVVSVLEEAGCDIVTSGRTLRMSAPARLRSVSTVRTMPYPGFPTDAQAPITAVCCVAEGTSVIIETIFESRFRHVSELLRLGAKIRVDGRMAVVNGVPFLQGAAVETPDLRGGVALVVAGLCAHGVTTVRNCRHIERGYEALELALTNLGASIRRMDENERKDDDEEEEEDGTRAGLTE